MIMATIPETYLLASQARAKLSHEAAKSDHNLRRLVGHANMLDNIMESIHNKAFVEPDTPAKVSFQPVRYTRDNVSDLTTVTYIEDDSDSSDDEDDDEDDDYDDDQVEELSTVAYESDEDDFSSDDDEELGPTELLSLRHSLNRSYRRLPTIEELSEQELDDLEDFLSSEDDEEEEVNEELEVDLADMKDTPPSLSYSSSTDDEEDASEEENHNIEEIDFADQQIFGPRKNVISLLDTPSLSFNFINQRPGVIC